ncbi:MAG: DUF928 domain-containing protein [Cyanobacteria bacterium P01_D01_bin.56]
MMIRFAALILVSSLIYTGPLSAVPIYAADPFADVERFHFNPPKDGIPDNTTGGASRNPSRCRRQETATKASNITLLAPSSFVGHTISEQPDFFLYAEHALAQEVFLNIENEQGEIIYSGYETLPTDTGLIRIILPDNAPSLIPDNVYRVTVLPVCEGSLRPDDPALVGYVKRISHIQPLAREHSESAFEEAIIYAESGIWYDTLMLLEETLHDTPSYTSVNAAWNMLLSIGELTQFDLTSNSFSQ